jgi:hypothetical protein
MSLIQYRILPDQKKWTGWDYLNPRPQRQVSNALLPVLPPSKGAAAIERKLYYSNTTCSTILLAFFLRLRLTMHMLRELKNTASKHIESFQGFEGTGKEE